MSKVSIDRRTDEAALGAAPDRLRAACSDPLAELHWPPARWPASLDALERERSVLLLQGPMGPFFDRLARHLLRAGVEVRKVHFNGGDEHYFAACRAERFTQPAAEWPAWLAATIALHRIQALVLFGQMRPLHQAARRVAEALGIAVYVFEEGYFRPHYVTLERGGVNADSALPRDALFYRRLLTLPPPAPQPAGTSFWRAARHATSYAWHAFAARDRYPHYQHHRDIGVLEALRWVRGGWRKALFHVTEAGVRRRLYAETPGHPWFLVALQVHNDAQVTCASPLGTVESFIERVIASFAREAPADATLVFKHHPMDRAHRDYRRHIASAARVNGIAQRVLYIHDAHLPTLLRRARGLVTLNSTTALQALHHGCPVAALGASVYTFEGLVHTGPLATFWRKPPPVDRWLFARFRDHVIAQSQLNAGFHGHAPGLSPAGAHRIRDLSPNRVRVPGAPTAQHASQPLDVAERGAPAMRHVEAAPH